MDSITPTSVHKIPAVAKRYWRPTAGVLGLAMAVTAFVVPWHHSSPSPMRSTANTAAVASSAPVTTPTATKAAAPAPTKAAPPASAVVNTTLTAKVPGKAPKMPWPHTGQAGISLVGGGVLGVSGKQSPAPTASMAKAMTAYIVLKDHPMHGGQSGPVIHVTRAEAAAVALDIRQDQQILHVYSGERLTEKQALDALMLKSANNVARILARWDAGSIPAFLNKMNATAKQLGMSSTHYTDPSGWDAKTLSTTTDQMKLASIAMERSDFARVVGTKSAIVPVEGRIANVNPLLGQDGIVGIKTGSMSAAGGCLMFAAKKSVAGQTVTVVGTVMGQRNGYIGDLHQAFASSKSLVEAMNRVVGSHRVIKAGQVVATVPSTHQQLVATKNVNVVGWSGMTYTQTIKATVAASAKAGAKVGSLTVTGGAAASVPVAVK
ncbi:MAG TPA: D-alanyl-D-alanine carboxypeptidase [Micromonosporaceae bacterium]|jgi:D-alanyl-D-alanine carboxypeptidase (penicillin-binding protein 5/6)